MPVTILADLSMRRAWGGLQGGSGDQTRIADDTNVRPPDARFTSSIHMRLQDGDAAPWDPTRAEVAQVQAGPVYPYGVMRWTSYWIRFNQVAPWSSLDWHIYTEAHRPAGGTSAMWAMNLANDKNRLRWTASGWNHHFPLETEGPNDIGNWHHIRLGFLPHTSLGRIVMYRDRTLLYDLAGIQTLGAVEDCYPKIGFYRTIGCNGIDDAHIAGYQITDADPGYPGEIIVPPPPPSDPCADLRVTLAQTVSDLNGAREARDQALALVAVRTDERDAAARMALELRARIDSAKIALG